MSFEVRKGESLLSFEACQTHDLIKLVCQGYAYVASVRGQRMTWHDFRGTMLDAAAHSILFI